jgi:hypothetical protein
MRCQRRAKDDRFNKTYLQFGVIAADGVYIVYARVEDRPFS